MLFRSGSQLKINQNNQIVMASAPTQGSGSLLGLRVVNPGQNYQNPQVIISAPTGDPGVLAQYLVNRTSGELLNANIVTSGFGYTVAPNVIITDTYTTETTADTTFNSYNLALPGDVTTNVFIGDTLTINSGNLAGQTGIVSAVNVSVGTVTLSSNVAESSMSYLSSTKDRKSTRLNSSHT